MYTAFDTKASKIFLGKLRLSSLKANEKTRKWLVVSVWWLKGYRRTTVKLQKQTDQFGKRNFRTHVLQQFLKNVLSLLLFKVIKFEGNLASN